MIEQATAPYPIATKNHDFKNRTGPAGLTADRSDRRPVTIPVQSGHLNRKVFRPELGRLNRWSDL